ncbi:PAS domain S-box protein [Cytobacillus sp. FJAT-54145]|uniref:histidine kinase n=1 Tax=Cytobacillus spartinae TaxID=3299023 RepID=A0ABW6KF17_9BACI
MTQNFLEIDSINADIFNRAFEYAPISMAVMDEEGKFLHVNSSLCDYLGYTEEELKKMSFHTVTHPKDLMLDLMQNTRLLNGEITTFQMEKRYIHKQGHTVWGLLKVSQAPFMGKMLTIGQVVDITEQKVSEVELKRLKSFYDLSSEGIGIFDLNGCIIQVNRAFEEIFGWKEDEIKGEKLPVTPDFTLDDARYLINETLEGRVVRNFETIKQRKDGRLITTSISMSPICDEENNTVALAGVVRDITEEKTVRSLLQSFIDNNLDPVLIFDQNGILIEANHATEKSFGWTVKELIGTNIDNLPLIPEDRIDEVQNYKIKVLKGNGFLEHETVRLRKDGTYINVLITSFPIEDHQHLINGFAVIKRDITERKKAEELMIQSEKLSIAGQLAAAIAHEIRNPLTSIKGFLKLLQYSNEKDLYYDIVHNEINRIELILTELLSLAKPQKSKMIQCDIRKTLEHVTSLLEAEANMNSIEIIKKFDLEVPVILCDENQIKQVFINFIKNAMEAMSNGGSLKIEVLLDDKIFIRFTDTGSGIPEEILSKIGQPFYTTKENGTGLGFMISKNIIENHNGTVKIISEVNKGTSVEVMLPLIQVQ